MSLTLVDTALGYMNHNVADLTDKLERAKGCARVGQTLGVQAWRYVDPYHNNVLGRAAKFNQTRDKLSDGLLCVSSFGNEQQAPGTSVSVDVAPRTQGLIDIQHRYFRVVSQTTNYFFSLLAHIQRPAGHLARDVHHSGK